MPDDEVSSLAALADKMRKGRAFQRMKVWLTRYPIDLHPEASLVYHLGLLLDYLDLPYE